MSDYMAQYVSSTDPEVLAAVEHNRTARAAAFERACEFAKRHGSKTGAHAGRDGRIFGVVTDDGEPPTTGGRWKRIRVRGSSHAWAPYKNNPLHAEMAAIRPELIGVPGVPDELEGPANPDSGQFYIAWPKPFAVSNVAYCGVNFTPRRTTRRSQSWGPQWTEITGGDYHSAIDAYNAAIKAEVQS